MESIFNCFGACGTSLHMIHFFDGQRIREIEVHTAAGIICWTEKNVPGILENGTNYKTATRRLAALERKNARRA